MDKGEILRWVFGALLTIGMLVAVYELLGLFRVIRRRFRRLQKCPMPL